jgi:hypothetical protein
VDGGTLVEKVMEMQTAAWWDGFLSGLRHGFNGVRTVEGRARCAGEAAGAETETTDEAVGMLVRRFPTVEYKRQWATRSMSNETLALSDKGVRAVSNLRALTHLDLSHYYEVTADVLRVMGDLPSLTALNLTMCDNVGDDVLRVMSSCNALTHNLTYCCCGVLCCT